VATLCILNDGSAGAGEVAWLRGDRVEIGRREGDVCIPHDGGISTPHAEIVRQYGEAGYCWDLKDTNSRNGIFLRVDTTAIRDGQFILIGHHLLRFDRSISLATQVAADVTEDFGAPDEDEETGQPPELAIVRRKGGEGQRFPLDPNGVWVGRDETACTIVLSDHAVDSRHARLYEGENHIWHIEDLASTNGVWIRVSEVTLRDGSEFQLGEQRFLFRIL